MAEFKKLSDVNVIESINDNLNVLVENGGEIVKIAANKVAPSGMVTSVNSVMPDENGNVTVEIPKELPEGASAYQQLVTDANGDVAWEERALYKIAGEPTALIPEGTVIEAVKYGPALDVSYNPETFVPFVLGQVYTGTINGTAFETTAVVDENDSAAVSLYPVINEEEWRIYQLDEMWYIFENKTTTLSVGDIITVSIKTAGELVAVPLNEEFIPTTVPVIQSAIVGQTIVVKTIDENGKPTEWEAVNIPVAAAVADAAGETPTAAEFNALLTALRNAGLLATE